MVNKCYMLRFCVYEAWYEATKEDEHLYQPKGVNLLCLPNRNSSQYCFLVTFSLFTAFFMSPGLFQLRRY